MIYSPAEDSYLIASELKKYVKGKSILDIGTGSGILALEAIKSKAISVLAADINTEVISNLNNIKLKSNIANLKVLKSDLFSNIPKESKFDIIVFNPPYLPLDNKEDKESQLTTTGGKNGDEIILKFLKKSPVYLKKEGIILLLVSSLTPKEKIISLLKKQSMNYQSISSKKLFFENLEVWKIQNENL